MRLDNLYVDGVSITRRQFITLAAALGLSPTLMSCASDRSNFATTPGGAYLLPVLGPGETMELSKVSWLWRSYTWFRRMDAKTAMFMVQLPYNYEWEPDMGDREHFLAAMTLVTESADGRQFRVIGLPSQRVWPVFIDAGPQEVILSVYSPAGLTATEVVAQLQDIPVPFPEGNQTVPGFTLNTSPVTEGLIYIKSPSHEPVLTAAFQTPAPGSIRVQDRYPGFSTVAVDGRNVEFATIDTSNPEEAVAAAWMEEDGLEVSIFRNAVVPLELPSLIRRFRRVNKADWDEAYTSHAVASDHSIPPSSEQIP